MSGAKPSPLAALAAKAKNNVDMIRQSEAQRSPSRMVPVDQIMPSPYQARKDFSNIEVLVADVAKNGVLQPILLRPLPAGNFELVAGERRWRASKMAGKANVPAVVREMSDEEARLYGLSENLLRQDLNAYEMAKAVLDLVALWTGKDETTLRRELSSKNPPEDSAQALEEALSLLGKRVEPRSFSRHYMPLLALPDELLRALAGGASYSAVMALSRASEAVQQEWLPRVVAGECSVRELKEALAELKPPKEQPEHAPELARLVGRRLERGLDGLGPTQQKRAQRLLAELHALLS